MRLTVPTPLDETVFAALDRRLSHDADHPVALALSGGGDSVALLEVATRWAALRGRRLLCLTVDHRLNADSARWSALAADTAHRLGAAWQGLVRQEALAPGGLPAAARRLRHALLADAARQAGARVILTGHTLDDLLEVELMRAEGSNVGRAQEWSPSPAWPQGRGLMMLRPLLGAGRGALRDHLRARGLGWIDDPANDDPRFARARARRSLADDAAPRSPATAGPGAARDQPACRDGVFTLTRKAATTTVAATVVCAGGGDQTPRGRPLQALVRRLGQGDDFTAVLAGARVEAQGDAVRVMREAGEFARGRLRPTLREGGGVLIWDGRYELAPPPGWSAAPAAGRMEALSRPDRSRLRTLAPGARGAAPVLVSPAGDRAVLALDLAGTRSLAPMRLRLALRQTTHEEDLDADTHGARGDEALFWDETCWTGRVSVARPWTEERNEPA